MDHPDLTESKLRDNTNTGQVSGSVLVDGHFDLLAGVTIHRSSGDVNVYAKYIISDVGVKNTFKSMLPRQIAEKSRKYIVKYVV